MADLRRPDSDQSLNQSPPYVDVDLFASDAPLQAAVAAGGGSEETAALSTFGRRWGSAEMLELGRLANEHPPRLQIFDPRGFRRDVVEFHPAYHRLMTESIADRKQPRTRGRECRLITPSADVVPRRGCLRSQIVEDRLLTARLVVAVCDRNS